MHHSCPLLSNCLMLFMANTLKRDCPEPLTFNLTDLTTFVLRHRIGIITAALMLGLDQAAKLVVVRMIPVGDYWPEDGYSTSPTQ